MDDAAEPRRLIQRLEDSAIGLAAMEHYMAITHALRRPTEPVLDAAASRSASPLVRAQGEQLPFPDGAFAGCWIERVLMHVDDPAAVIVGDLLAAAGCSILDRVEERSW